MAISASPEATLTEREMASLAGVDEPEDPGLGEPSREGLADDGERGPRDERELIAALACAGEATFGPCMPGFRAQAPVLGAVQPDHRLRGDRGSWTAPTAG
jgi:hypothetical protein